MTITCFCDHVIDLDDAETQNLGESPEVYEKILVGSFQNILCPQCGTLLKPELKTRFVDSSKNLDFLFLPEKQRRAFLLGKIECPQPRLVIGYPELVEKIKLVKEGLDERAIETIKFFLLRKSGSEDVRILYDHGDGNRLTFHISGLREKEVAVAHIPMTLYESTVKSLGERARSEEFAYLYTPPYISINKISAEED